MSTLSIISNENKKIRVMIVDCDDIHRAILGRILLEKGFEVIAVANGRAAIVEIETSAPDIVILEYELPDILGVDVLKIIRGTRNSLDLPIIMVTEHEADEEIFSCLTEGANDVVFKPMNLTLLSMRIEIHMMHKSTELKLRYIQNSYEKNMIERRMEMEDIKSDLNKERTLRRKLEQDLLFFKSEQANPAA